ncbi:MAG: rubrerythrin family protein, partial [Thermoplasmata archaeon]
MGKMTDKSLEEAYAGESQAHMKYLIFSDVAEREGKPNIARMFRAIAYAERVHATNHFKELEKVGDTEENLQSAMDGEDFEVHWM